MEGDKASRVLDQRGECCTETYPTPADHLAGFALHVGREHGPLRHLAALTATVVAGLSAEIEALRLRQTEQDTELAHLRGRLAKSFETAKMTSETATEAVLQTRLTKATVIAAVGETRDRLDNYKQVVTDSIDLADNTRLFIEKLAAQTTAQVEELTALTHERDQHHSNEYARLSETLAVLSKQIAEVLEGVACQTPAAAVAPVPVAAAVSTPAPAPTTTAPVVGTVAPTAATEPAPTTTAPVVGTVAPTAATEPAPVATEPAPVATEPAPAPAVAPVPVATAPVPVPAPVPVEQSPPAATPPAPAEATAPPAAAPAEATAPAAAAPAETTAPAESMAPAETTAPVAAAPAEITAPADAAPAESTSALVVSRDTGGAARAGSYSAALVPCPNCAKASEGKKSRVLCLSCAKAEKELLEHYREQKKDLRKADSEAKKNAVFDKRRQLAQGRWAGLQGDAIAQLRQRLEDAGCRDVALKADDGRAPNGLRVTINLD